MAERTRSGYAARVDLKCAFKFPPSHTRRAAGVRVEPVPVGAAPSQTGLQAARENLHCLPQFPHEAQPGAACSPLRRNADTQTGPHPNAGSRPSGPPTSK
jgi:hypothetical protein